jgi:hypothetical protein
MNRSRNITKKLVLGSSAIRELKLGELERIDGGSGSDTSAVDGKAVVPPPEDPRGGYVINC